MKAAVKGTKKILYRSFRYRNCDDLAALLQDMAMKGWHFTQWKLGLEFEKGIPQSVCYRVEVFPDASNYDYLPEQEALEYSEYCRAAGWTLVDAKRKFCIFRQDRPDTRDIVTEEERFSNIKRAEYSLCYINVLICLFCHLLCFFTVSSRRPNLYELLFDESLFLAAFLFLCAVGQMVLLFTIVLRFHQQKQLICQGIRPFYGTRNRFIKYLPNAFFYAAVILILLFFPIFFAVLICFNWYLEKKRPSREDFPLYTVISFLLAFFVLIFALQFFHKDPDSQTAAENQARAESFPLLKEDYAPAKNPIVYSRYEKHYGIMGVQRYYVLNYGIISQSDVTGKEETHTSDIVCYRIYETRHPWLLDKMWEGQTRSLENPEDCAKEWNSEKALHARIGFHYYYILYPGKIIVLDSLQPLTPEQMEAAAGKLSAA